tara:strand:- start:122 stop:1276 length:1155 start_codon:yes stop_codon:yes gene_type:complete
MIKKIAILGSTGSIGKSLLNLLRNDKNKKIILLSANRNYRQLIRQAKEFKVKNIIISNKKNFNKLKNDNRFKNINIYNDYECFKKIFKNKIDYTMSAIIGIDGLLPTLKIIKHSKIIAIANKESIICGWNLIEKELKKYKTKFLPVDSEHFSIWFDLYSQNPKNIINKILITASGGPFREKKISSLKNISIKDAINHPNWTMGKKISIDSATMVNKIFELIEAKNIFNLSYDQLSIIIHPKSYIHALIQYKNGLSKIILHETDMRIPIFNTLNFPNIKNYNPNKINFDILNNLRLSNPNLQKYPSLKLLKYLPKKSSLFETIIVSANDELVSLFLKKKIKFTDITKNLLKIVKDAKYAKYKLLKPKKIGDIIKLNRYVRSEINN